MHTAKCLFVECQNKGTRQRRILPSAKNGTRQNTSLPSAKKNTRQSRLYRVSDKIHSAKLPALNKVPVSGSAMAPHGSIGAHQKAEGARHGRRVHHAPRSGRSSTTRASTTSSRSRPPPPPMLRLAETTTTVGAARARSACQSVCWCMCTY